MQRRLGVERTYSHLLELRRGAPGRRAGKSASLPYHASGPRGDPDVRIVYLAGRVRCAVRRPREARRRSARGPRSARPRGAVERRSRSLPIGRRPVTIDFAIPRAARPDRGAIRRLALGFADAGAATPRPSSATPWTSPDA